FRGSSRTRQSRWLHFERGPLIDAIALGTVSYFFFFQAEDGIRDRNVTGVQTCALPISALARRSTPALICALKRLFDSSSAFVPRSEERRVGKECRSRWWPAN